MSIYRKPLFKGFLVEDDNRPDVICIMLSITSLIQLSKNDIKSKYASSIFGFAWAFILPLTTILVFWYVFQLGFKNLPISGAPFILWFSAGYIPWVFMSDCLMSGTNSIIEYSYLVKKIKFNGLTIPIIKLVSSLIIHIFFIVFIVIMSVILDYRITVYAIQIIYYCLAACAISAGLVFFLSAVTVFFRDMSAIASVLIQIGFWITPIMWNEKAMVNESVQKVLALNPAHYIVQGYRDALINHRWIWENMSETIYFWTVTICICIVGFVVFRKLQPFFADEV